jgi:PAS domain S-box-containing protein
MNQKHKKKDQLLAEIRELKKQLKELRNLNSSDSTESTLSLNSVEGEDRYRLLFELSPSGIILEDQEGIILDVNEAFCRSIGYRRKELIGKHVGILAHPDVKDQVDDNISRLLSGKVLKHNEKSVRKDGSICYMELHETKVILPDGGIGILCVADDHTERVQAEEERMQRQKLQGALELAGAVCHELNQPLTIISITSDLLKDFPDGKNLGGNIDIIKKEISRMGEITKKLMKITKYETRQYLNGNKILDIDKASQDKA